MNEPAVDQPMGDENATQGSFEAPAEESRPSIEKFESWEELEKGYKELEAYRGNSIRIPSGEASDEQRAEFYEKLSRIDGVTTLPNMEDPEAVASFYQTLGRPESPEGYQFEPVDGLTPDDDMAFAQTALNANLTRQQANYVREELTNNLMEAEKAQHEAVMESVDGLKQKWGKAYEHNINLAKAAAKQLDEKLPGVADYMNNVDPNGPFDVNTVQMLNLFAGYLGETGAMDTGRPDGIMTPEEAMLQAQDIRNNPEHPYNNDLDPAHAAAQKKMADLYKIAYNR